MRRLCAAAKVAFSTAVCEARRSRAFPARTPARSSSPPAFPPRSRRYRRSGPGEVREKIAHAPTQQHDRQDDDRDGKQQRCPPAWAPDHEQVVDHAGDTRSGYCAARPTPSLPTATCSICAVSAVSRDAISAGRFSSKNRGARPSAGCVVPPRAGYPPRRAHRATTRNRTAPPYQGRAASTSHDDQQRNGTTWLIPSRRRPRARKAAIDHRRLDRIGDADRRRGRRRERQAGGPDLTRIGARLLPDHHEIADPPRR